MISRFWRRAGSHGIARLVILIFSAMMAACGEGGDDPGVASTSSAVQAGDISIGGAPGSDLAIASWGPGRYDLFYTTGGHLKHRWHDGAWSPYEEDLGGDLASAPAAVSWASNRIDIFAMGRQNQLMHLWWDGTWHPWESLGGMLNSAPAVASWAAGRLDIFYAAVPSGLGHVVFDQGWHPHEILDGAAVCGAPSAVSWGVGRIDVFARMAPSGGPLWHKWLTGAWSGWESLGGNVASAPAATSLGANQLDIYYLGPDSALKVQSWNGSWHPERSLSGSYSGAPAAVASSNNHVEVVLPQVSLGIAERTWLDVPPPWLLWPDGCQSPSGIVDLGYPDFRVNADVNGDGYPDYCQFVGDSPNTFLSCQLACPPGGYGVPYGFNSIYGIDWGYAGTRQMKDVNGDGRADFCRDAGDATTPFTACDLATDTGFSPDQYDVADCTAQNYRLVRFWAGESLGTPQPTAVIGDPLNVFWQLSRNPQPLGDGPPVYLNGQRIGVRFWDDGTWTGATNGPSVTTSTPTHYDLVWPLSCGTQHGSIDVMLLSPRLGTVSFSANLSSITNGQTVRLSYSIGADVADGSLCALTADVVGRSVATGQTTYDAGAAFYSGRLLDVMPAETTDYTLTASCTNTPSIRQTSVVRVTVAPRETTAAITLYPTIGTPGYVGALFGIPGGVLERISNPSIVFSPLYVQLVKFGHNTGDCGDPNAVVFLGPGGSTDDITSIAGGAGLDNGLTLIACPGATTLIGQTIPPFQLNVTYRY